jgi:hypothetical protein
MSAGVGWKFNEVQKKGKKLEGKKSETLHQVWERL